MDKGPLAQGNLNPIQTNQQLLCDTNVLHFSSDRARYPPGGGRTHVDEFIVQKLSYQAIRL